LNAVMMLGLEDYETLPLLIYRAVDSYRYGTACAAGTTLILACAAAFVLSDAGIRRRGKSPPRTSPASGSSASPSTGVSTPVTPPPFNTGVVRRAQLFAGGEHGA
jgi:hypothetical protein